MSDDATRRILLHIVCQALTPPVTTTLSSPLHPRRSVIGAPQSLAGASLESRYNFAGASLESRRNPVGRCQDLCHAPTSIQKKGAGVAPQTETTPTPFTYQGQFRERAMAENSGFGMNGVVIPSHAMTIAISRDAQRGRSSLLLPCAMMAEATTEVLRAFRQIRGVKILLAVNFL